MSIFGSILAAIYHGVPSAPPETEKPFSSGLPGQPGSPPVSAEAAASFERVVIHKVNVDAVLSGRAELNKGNLDWQNSIVDLLKLLELDSSLAARKQLAEELDYNGDPADIAAMDSSLHKQVMQKLAENGGNVSAELLH